ncbi:Hypothetical predicted protein [Olea europaea subsp. europaea]|uniref:Uncharacterized protein n=1 Tax=Olea europaea subsp. europaea TaxID=158383 RepID=A0A8S0V8F9_OLEEU|nr:Hypothetical predicted protein [Olea europaea subsp. europaea]
MEPKNTPTNKIPKPATAICTFNKPQINLHHRPPKNQKKKRETRKPDFATVTRIGPSTGGIDRRYRRRLAHRLRHLIILAVLEEVDCCFGECERYQYHHRCVDTIIAVRDGHPIEFDVRLLCCACVRVSEKRRWLGGSVELGGFLGFGWV